VVHSSAATARPSAEWSLRISSGGLRSERSRPQGGRRADQHASPLPACSAPRTALSSKSSSNNPLPRISETPPNISPTCRAEPSSRVECKRRQRTMPRADRRSVRDQEQDLRPLIPPRSRNGGCQTGDDPRPEPTWGWHIIHGRQEPRRRRDMTGIQTGSPAKPGPSEGPSSRRP